MSFTPNNILQRVEAFNFYDQGVEELEFSYIVGGNVNSTITMEKFGNVT